MQIYEHRTSQTAASGIVASSTLKVCGMLQNVFVSAGSDNTLFKFDLVDDGGITRVRFDYHYGEINKFGLGFPMRGEYTCNITNASIDDTFDIVLGVEE